MPHPTILVTGASGRTGGALVAELLERGASVRAVVRRADDRARRLADSGADVVVADLFDPEQVRRAMEGTSRAYYVAPYHPHALHSAVAFADAARRSGVEAIVGLSQWLAGPDHPSLLTRHQWLIDQLFDMVPGAAHITLNPGYFADNYLLMTGLAAQVGMLPIPMGGRRNAPPSNEDIARVAATALLDPERHAGRTYRPTGPELLSGRDMAEVLTDVLGRRVRHAELPTWMYLRALRVQGPRYGVDPYLATNVRHYVDEHKLGTWEIGAPTTHVRDVTGQDAEDFATVARRYARRPNAQRTARNLARELRDLMLIGILPGWRLARVRRLQQQPEPVAPQLAAHSDAWKLDHAGPAAPATRMAA